MSSFHIDLCMIMMTTKLTDHIRLAFSIFPRNYTTLTYNINVQAIIFTTTTTVEHTLQQQKLQDYKATTNCPMLMIFPAFPSMISSLQHLPLHWPNLSFRLGLSCSCGQAKTCRGLACGQPLAAAADDDL